jgi:hypothetical protein
VICLFLQEKCFKVLKAVQDAFYHFFSMLLNGAYASKFETGLLICIFKMAAQREFGI